MSNHVSEWLNAYFDGELTGKLLHQVEDHLAECEACQAELDSLEGLSELLHDVPAPEFTPADRFAAQVNLRIPHKQVVISRKQVMEAGWWMIGLLSGPVPYFLPVRRLSLVQAEDHSTANPPGHWAGYVSLCAAYPSRR